MSRVAELMETNRWCYWLDQCSPSPDNPNEFRVSIVVENEMGHFPTGDAAALVEPWYWCQECCRYRNEKRGISEKDELDIVGSSMFPRKK